MKKINIIWLILSSAILLLTAYAIIDSLVSYKYEIEEPPRVDKIDIELAAGYLNSRIICLWCFLSYVGINVVFLFISIFSKKK